VPLVEPLYRQQGGRARIMTMSLTPFHVCCPITKLTICRCDNYATNVADLSQFAQNCKRTFQLYIHTCPQYEKEEIVSSIHDEKNVDILSNFEKESTDHNQVSITHRLVIPAKIVHQQQQLQRHQQQQQSTSTSNLKHPIFNLTNSTSINPSDAIQNRIPQILSNPMISTTSLSSSKDSTISLEKQQQLYQQMILRQAQKQQVMTKIPSNSQQQVHNLRDRQILQSMRIASSENSASSSAMYDTDDNTGLADANSKKINDEKSKRSRGRPRKRRACMNCEKGDFSAHKLDPQLLQCVNCKACIHTYCHDPNLDHLPPVFRQVWRCEDCKVCEICQQSADEEKLLICEHCDRGFHTYCLKPPLKEIPKGSWNCMQCTALKRNSQFMNQIMQQYQEQNSLRMQQFATYQQQQQQQQQEQVSSGISLHNSTGSASKNRITYAMPSSSATKRSTSSSSSLDATPAKKQKTDKEE
jgi:Pyruvate/2-oxoacid:ferredoxin oxidoreductase delta subunit